jgi:hypothetical protein
MKSVLAWENYLIGIVELHRQANREGKGKLTDSDLPYLWILTPTLAAETLTSFDAITEVEVWGEHKETLSREAIEFSGRAARPKLFR